MEDVEKEEATENAEEDRRRCRSRDCLLIGWSGEMAAVTHPWGSWLWWAFEQSSTAATRWEVLC